MTMVEGRLLDHRFHKERRASTGAKGEKETDMGFIESKRRFEKVRD